MNKWENASGHVSSCLPRVREATSFTINQTIHNCFFFIYTFDILLMLLCLGTRCLARHVSPCILIISSAVDWETRPLVYRQCTGPNWTSGKSNIQQRRGITSGDRGVQTVMTIRDLDNTNQEFQLPKYRARSFRTVLSSPTDRSLQSIDCLSGSFKPFPAA